MTNTSTTTSRTGPSTLSLLGIAFIILKLCHVINWSWLWVLAPFWVGFALLGVILVLGLGLAGVAAVLDARSKRKRKTTKRTHW